MYVCTEKVAIQEWLKEIEELKAENKRLEELLTKWKDKRIEVLIKENRELKEEIKKWKMVADENWTGYDMMKDEYEKLEKENKELKKKLDILYHHI